MDLLLRFTVIHGPQARCACQSCDSVYQSRVRDAVDIEHMADSFMNIVETNFSSSLLYHL